MLAEQAQRLLVGVIGEAGLLAVAHPLGLLRQRVVVGAHRPRGRNIGHAELEDHRAGDLRDLLEVAGGAVRDPAEDDLLGGAAGERDLHHVEQLFLRVQVAILDRKVVGEAERVAAADDGHLLHRHHVAHQIGNERVAALVVGEDPLLLLGHDAALLEAGEHPLHRSLEVLLADVLLVVARREDCCLVRDVREVGAGEPGGATGDDRDVDIGTEGLRARVDGEDLLAALEIGRRDVDLAVEAARAQERGIEILQAGSRLP